ncbi:MAG: GDSL-type esterase/lipase family protein [Tannerellaceae bacterium]|jgi:lysophospholipase L1-like esterase|nr:GDSL-type esterase/lipase family protein [Tannerellaceae bacterium]
MKDSRRDFLKKSVLAGAGALVIPELARAVVKEQSGVNASKIALKKNAVVLMQGDSITDAGRTYGNNNCNTQEQLGFGYSLYIATQLLAKQADKQLKIYNRGISGNKVYQLRDRWEMECLAFQPDVLSILIGVNDYWHTLGGGYKGTAEIYENDYRDLLKYTKEKSPATQLIICEPFALKGGSAIEDEKWFPKFDEYRTIAQRLAAEFKAVFVPFQAGFDAAMRQAPARYWSNDGVHPDLPGRQLMANMWIEATGL